MCFLLARKTQHLQDLSAAVNELGEVVNILALNVNLK